MAAPGQDEVNNQPWTLMQVSYETVKNHNITAMSSDHFGVNTSVIYQLSKSADVFN